VDRGTGDLRHVTCHRLFILDVKDGCNILTGMEAVSDRVGGFAG
jgi:hypothetical protein